MQDTRPACDISGAVRDDDERERTGNQASRRWAARPRWGSHGAVPTRFVPSRLLSRRRYRRRGEGSQAGVLRADRTTAAPRTATHQGDFDRFARPFRRESTSIQTVRGGVVNG